MTKEDIKQICQIYDNFRSERDAATIAYNSDDIFWEHILATYNLSQPSLPSNLDEAAKEWVRQIMRISDKVHKYLYTYLLDAFRAGEEFHAKQGITKEAVIGMATEDVEINVSQRVLDALDTCPGDKIRIQITKIE